MSPRRAALGALYDTPPNRPVSAARTDTAETNLARPTYGAVNSAQLRGPVLGLTQLFHVCHATGDHRPVVCPLWARAIVSQAITARPYGNEPTGLVKVARFRREAIATLRGLIFPASPDSPEAVAAVSHARDLHRIRGATSGAQNSSSGRKHSGSRLGREGAGAWSSINAPRRHASPATRMRVSLRPLPTSVHRRRGDYMKLSDRRVSRPATTITSCAAPRRQGSRIPPPRRARSWP
jgi:hypothetical protein